MRNTSTVLLLGIGVALSLFVAPNITHAQTNPPVTSVRHPSIDESLCLPLNGTMSADGKTCTRTNADTSTTVCTAGSCKVSFPDGSYTTVEPGSFAGQTVKNYDSTGKLIGTTDSADGNALINANTGQQANKDVANTGADVSCGITHLDTCMEHALLWFVKQIILLFLRLANVFVALGGAALNWVVYITIFQFGNIVGNNAGLLAAWGVLRDIGNMLLLFGFIFMGISTILNLPGNEFTAKRALPTLIIFAVLMNFSLFAAEAVIDVSNAFGATFYKQVGTAGCPSNIDNKTCATQYGIGASVMTVSGLSTIFDQDAQKIIGSQGDDAQVMIYLCLSILAMVTAFVFFAAVFMFIARMVVLAFIMVTSPIGFAGMAIPPLHEVASSWWKQLLNQSFFAPIYILLVLVSVQFMKGVITALSGGQALSLATVFAASGQPTFSIFIIFLLVIGFLLAAVVLASQMGAAGAKFATARAAGLTFGTVGFIGRRTVGQAAFRGAEALERTKFGRTNPIGKFSLNTLNATKKASFDVRGVAAVSGAAKTQHVDIGKAQKGGYDHVVHEEQKKREEYAKNLKNTPEEERLLGQIDTDIKKQKDLDAKALAAIDARNAEERADLENDVRRLTTEAAEAKKRGDKKAEQDAETALNTRQRMLDDMKQRQATERKRVENDQNKVIADKEASKKKVKDAPKTEYAATLHSNYKNPLDWWDIVGGVGQHSGHHAAEKIQKDLNKNEVQKLLDEIDNVKKKTEGNGGHGGGDHGGGDDHGGGGDHGGGH